MKAQNSEKNKTKHNVRECEKLVEAIIPTRDRPCAKHTYPFPPFIPSIYLSNLVLKFPID